MNNQDKCRNRVHNIILTTLLMMVICINTSYASTNTIKRTQNNLMISSDIEVTSSNLDNILKTPKVNASEKVYDFADLFSSLEESQIYNAVNEYISNSNMDMVIVTIEENDKINQIEYADDFYDYNDFGIGPTHDGLILLIDMDNRQIHIGTTGQAMVMYDDIRIEKLLDEVYNGVSNSRYADGVLDFVDKAAQMNSSGIPSSNKNAYIDSNGDYVYDPSNNYNNMTFKNAIIYYMPNAAIGAVILTIIFIGTNLYKARKPKRATNARYYLKNGSLKLSQKVDQFVTSNTVKTKIETSSGHGAGGSSIHIGSSGRSHGGGSRGF